jgi:hypothetical protein
MIDLKGLVKKDVGRAVTYTSIGTKESGRIKSWNDRWIFVVYHCADDWDNYQDYTAAATDSNDLDWG